MKEYSEMFVPLYDLDTQDVTDDIPFYQEMVRRTGGPILEPMCGTGRVLLPLARAGHMVVGIDSSAPMLTVARARFAAAHLTTAYTLTEADIRHAPLPDSHFGLIFIALNSFMHIEHTNEQLALLCRLRQALAPNGVLVLDVYNPNTEHLAQEDNRMILEHHYRWQQNDVYKFVASENDMALQISNMHCFYDVVDTHGNVTRHTTSFRLRWFYCYELEHLLARAGFQVEGIYGSYDLDYYTSSSERLIAVASQPAPDVVKHYTTFG